ncbi:MAG: metallophosphatase family protein [Chloroflexota bacterium]|nr:metallophosphatase family protein [Chloroflexota bacterium]
MRYLILSDIHANLVALDAVLEAADLSTIDQVWCLGDVVGYGPNPNECVARMKELATYCLVGNHDWAALGKIDVSDFNPEARKAVLWTQEHLSKESIAFLASLEGRLDNVHPHFTLAHGSPRHPIWEYLLYPSSAEENFDFFDTRYCLVGHTHKPIIFRQEMGQEDVLALQPAVNLALPLAQAENIRFIINPGSVGQPRDNDPRAAYAIYDDDEGTLTFHRLPYDIGATQRRMRVAGLPERLIQRLEYGW